MQPSESTFTPRQCPQCYQPLRWLDSQCVGDAVIEHWRCDTCKWILSVFKVGSYEEVRWRTILGFGVSIPAWDWQGGLIGVPVD
jgi:hypothetical protein